MVHFRKRKSLGKKPKMRLTRRSEVKLRRGFPAAPLISSTFLRRHSRLGRCDIEEEPYFLSAFTAWPQPSGSANQIDRLTPISEPARSEHPKVPRCNNKVCCGGVTKCPRSVDFPSSCTLCPRATHLIGREKSRFFFFFCTALTEENNLQSCVWNLGNQEMQFLLWKYVKKRKNPRILMNSNGSV